MTLLQIQYALECYATGSLSKAAQNLFTSVSNLSKTLHALEDELGCELFVRTSSGVTPTELGRGFFVHARAVMDECKQMADLRKETPTYSFSCASVPVFSFSAAFVRLTQEYQGKGRLNFKFDTSDVGTIVDDIAKRHTDLGIVAVYPDSPADYQYFHRHGLDCRELMKTQLAVYLRPEHPALQNGQKQFDFAALHAYPYESRLDQYSFYQGIADSVPAIFRNPFDRSCRSRVYVTDRALRRRLLHETDTFTTMPANQTLAAAQKLVCLPIPGVFTTYACLFPADAPLSPVAERYLALLRQEMDSCTTATPPELPYPSTNSPQK